MVKVLSSVLLTLALLSTCGRPPSPIEKNVVGSWTWTYGVGGDLDEKTTGLALGCLLQLKAEHRFLFECHGRSAEGTYTIGGDSIAYPTGYRGPLISFSSELPVLADGSWVVSVNGDTLFLRTLAYDEYDHVFLRDHGQQP